MFSINCQYAIDDTVYYVQNNSVQSGVVVKVSTSGTVVTYMVRVGSGTVTKEEDDLYGNCKAEGGYQNATFTSGLSTSTVMIPKGSLPIIASSESVQDVLNNLNSVLTPVADAHIVQNNIRITSRSSGATSTVAIPDGDLVVSPTGFPLELPYFETLATFTGLSPSVEGKALETLGQQVC